MDEKSKVLWALLATFLTADALTTWFVVSKAGIAAELNPLAKGLISNFGGPSIALRWFVVMAMGTLLWRLSEGEKMYLIPLGPSVVLGVVVVINMLSVLSVLGVT